MSPESIVNLVNTWPGSLLLLGFVVISVHASGLAFNCLIGIKTRGIESIAYSAASGSLIHALLGIIIAFSGNVRHVIAIVLFVALLSTSAFILAYQKLIPLIHAELDNGDRTSIAIYLAFISLCCGLTYLPINFPTALPDGLYVFKSHSTAVKIQVMTGDFPADNYIPHVVSEYLLRGISFRAEHPIMPGQEVTDRPILMPLVVVPFRSLFNQPPMQEGVLPRFQFVGQSWPDVSIFGGDRIFRQFLIVAIFLNGLLILGAAMVFKRSGSSTIQVAGCLLVFLNPYFITQTIFTWPKSMASFFTILALYSLEYLESRPYLTAGVLVGLGYLSHPFALFYAVIFGAYALYRFWLKKCSYAQCLGYFAALGGTVSPWFFWKWFFLRLPSDLAQQNLGLNANVVDAIWVRLHNTYETLGGRMFEAYPFNANQFVELTILCIPGVVGLAFVAHGYREVLSTLRTRPLVSVFGCVIPAFTLICFFGYPAAVPILHGMQVVGLLVLLLALQRYARQLSKRTLYVAVAVQFLLNGSLLCIRGSNLGVLNSMAQSHAEAAAGVQSLIGWPETTVRNAKIAPNINVSIAIGASVKTTIWLNPPGQVVFAGVKLGANPVFAVSIGIHQHVWTEDSADGAEFQVEVSDGSKTAVVMKKFIDPVHILQQRRWNDVTADLSQFRNETVRITLKSLPGPAGKDYADWCLWGEPRVLNRGPGQQ